MMRNNEDSNTTDWMTVPDHDVMTGIAGLHSHREKLAVHANYIATFTYDYVHVTYSMHFYKPSSQGLS